MTELSSDHEAEIARLFWAARKEHVKGEEGVAHAEAVEFAHQHSLDWFESLLKASRFGKENPDGALEILASTGESVPELARGLVEFLRGWAFYNQGNLDESIAAFRRTLEMPSYGPPGIAWTNLGVALGEKGDLEASIEAYRRALETPGYDSPGYAWNNLGIALRLKGDLKQAVEQFERALEILDPEEASRAWANLGNVYSDLGDVANAKNAFEKALEAARNDSERARARLGLQVVESRLKPEELTPDDRALLQEPTRGSDGESIEERLVEKINRAGVTQYDRYVEKKDSGRGDSLNVLRGWSSSVTLLDGSDRKWRGGGYFFKWGGFGIVIDPGFDFLRNFHDAEFHAREISAVFVSHNHPDHNADLKDIDDLRYEVQKRLGGKDQAEPMTPYLVVWDEDTSRVMRFSSEQAAHRIDPIVVSGSSPQEVDLAQDQRVNLPVRMKPFKARHGEDVRWALGTTIELLDDEGDVAFRLGYTADTEYFDGLAGHLQHCDALIAHVSQPSVKELQDASELKSIHLGYRGTARLLRECQPRLALLGEFWAGFTDLRIDLAKGIRRLSGVDHVLPTGLGMHLHLPSLDIECTECSQRTPYKKIRVAPPTDAFGALAYLCPSCLLD